MRIRIQVVIEGEDGHEETIEEVGCLDCVALRPEELGLTLCEAKQFGLYFGCDPAVKDCSSSFSEPKVKQPRAQLANVLWKLPDLPSISVHF